MPRLYLMSLSLIGILAFAPQVSAQEPIEATPELQVQAQPPAAEQRDQSVAAQRRAEPRGSRPQGDNPRVGTAEPRAARPAPTARQAGRDRNNGPRRVVVAPRVYGGYPYPYAYSGRYLPSRRGVFGSAYLYYGPRFYYGPRCGGYYAGDRYFGSHLAYGQAYDIGELRLRVSPRDAQVFVDGDYAGTVDDYDGTFQSLKLESGSYSIRLEAPGYET